MARVKVWAAALLTGIAAVAVQCFAGTGNADDLPAGIAITSAPADAWTPEVIETLNPSTSLRGGLWSHDAVPAPGSPTATGSLWLRLQPDLSDSVRLFAEGWVDGNKSLGENPRDRVRGELREAWVSYQMSPIDLRFGRQIVVWGRADRINPTDRISSRDFTLLFPDDDDLRRGNLMARSRIALSDTGTWEVLWLPEFRPDVPRLPPPPPGVRSSNLYDQFAADQFATRYDDSGGRFDWSVSYFRGLDRWPDLSLSGFPAAPSIDRRYHRIDSVGADLATTVSGFGFRAEAAYVHTENADGDRPDIKRPYTFLVAGGDRDLAEGLNLNLQYVYRHVFSFRDPSSYPAGPIREIATDNAILSEQTVRNRHGFTARLAYVGFNDLLRAEVSTLVYPAQGEALVRGKVSYALTDTLRATVGFDRFLGSTTTYLGSLRESSAAYVELRLGF